jgi:hypothetical protein
LNNFITTAPRSLPLQIFDAVALIGRHSLTVPANAITAVQERRCMEISPRRIKPPLCALREPMGDVPSWPVVGARGMELLATPLLCLGNRACAPPLWQVLGDI